jgi:Protein of unknown function (DUF2808)
MKSFLTCSLLTSWLGMGCVTARGIVASPPSAIAVQLADGTVYFTSPPQLGRVSATNSAVDAWVVTYYFTLTVPEKAGEPLGKVTIAQSEGTDRIRFSPQHIKAFAGMRDRHAMPFTLGEVVADRQTQTVTVNFNPPVPPGQTVTIALSPDRNPLYGGVYLFGVTAFPTGEKSHGQFLGFGRLHFYESGHDARLFRHRWHQ